MSFSDTGSIWQRDQAIDLALLDFYDLGLRFPSSAARLASGNLHMRRVGALQHFKREHDNKNEGDIFAQIFDGPGVVHELTLEQKSEDVAWHSHLRASVAIISRIYHASIAHGIDVNDQDRLRKRGDQAIASIIALTWRSIEHGAKNFFDGELRAKVEAFVRNEEKLEASRRAKSEKTDA